MLDRPEGGGEHTVAAPEHTVAAPERTVAAPECAFVGIRV